MRGRDINLGMGSFKYFFVISIIVEHLNHIEDKVYKRLEELYEKHYNSVWEVGWSGGKDSTLLVHFLLSFFLRLKNRKKSPPRTYIVHTDTLLEHPSLQKVTKNTAKRISLFIKNNFDNKVKLMWLTPEKDFLENDSGRIPHASLQI